LRFFLGLLSILLFVLPGTSSMPGEEEVEEAGGGVTIARRSSESAFEDVDRILTGVGVSGEDSSVIWSDDLVRRRVEIGVDETLAGETAPEETVKMSRRVEVGILMMVLLVE
jgi:hypothetical protein